MQDWQHGKGLISFIPLLYCQPYIQFCFNSHFNGISISTLEIWQERTSGFYLCIEWTSVFKGFYILKGPQDY